MSDFDSNPFADPVNTSPFQDPSVQQATANSSRGLEEFNPFEDRNKQTTKSTPAVPPAAPPPAPAQQQPAVVNTSSAQQPPPYSQSAAQPAMAAAQEDLLKRQEELEQKAAELQRREQQLRNAQFNTRENNWPPLPKWFPLQPCFYQDFSVDIPLEFQRTVKMGYYLWIVYSVVMIINVFITAAYFFVATTIDTIQGAGTCFGLSLLLLILFIPGSYVCWFRPVYKAFRSDSSFNFFLFFFIFFFQFIASVIQAIGLDGFGTCGWINGLNLMGQAQGGQRIVAGLMLIVGAAFTTMAVLDAIFLHKVHTLYRGTGASFEKAQQEFAKNVVSNPGVQSATKQAASAAVSGAVDASINNRM